MQLASVTFALSSYNSVFQSYVNHAAPIDENPTPPPEALASVFRELVKRETKIQASILALAPTFEFARVEPKFLVPFNAPVLLKIIRSLQLILDRLREARTAIGTAGFNETIHHDFASVVSHVPFPRCLSSELTSFLHRSCILIVFTRRSFRVLSSSLELHLVR